ncbi:MULTISPECIES: YjjG family noncanonical pyrimidine nucleotidase [Clostridium]|uniref:YjjG family noncanonical pyrimidine nucleotidase n=1 Tax=Clostridium TaxID=1485 RepID=UPI0006672BCC|nr:MULTISPECIES: YjjG family noncanonical pyrimidine nucleotidase [Clostridium]MBS7131563.1 YjjG family noncanonical pyrimidine nucleotidase [Clostridium sp.]MDB2075988.1 YjjG family noncanonical pyrimidine nucleotidase [Clostridium paraputrificum]MDB2079204.1 YjjG family noncanonical pyrimidine nucleotidase [Clostridium paraputrificum]MDB2091255.1 YjjG family noncanonical pyrimidine nucleotidase [Clostridium paraputrificum]MDB2099500.1 YjjG family noncanonical pyrimidine nucleotidase [Clostri
MKYQVLLFDADETLFDFKMAEKQAFLRALEEYKLDVDKEESLKLYSQINKHIWEEFERGEITADRLRVERFERFSKKIKIDFDAVSFSKAYAKFLGEGAYLFDDSVEVIDYLSKKYKLALVTNGLKDVQKSRISKTPLKDYFQELIISDEIKISKPDPRIFDYALDKLDHMDKSKVLMIGDSLTSDMQGGINAGIDTCWYNPNHLENKSGLNLTYEIHSLNELKEIL